MRRRRGLLLFVGSATALAAFWAVGGAYAGGWALDLGSITFPPPRYAAFLLAWILLGGLAAALLAFAFADLVGDRAAEGTGAGPKGRDRAWILSGAAAAFLVPLALRHLLLRGMPLTDDESAYRFMAFLLGHGHLTAPSPAMKAFFDRKMMIDDGHLYALYFLGWPALLAPWLRLGIPGAANAFYSAVTVPPLFLVTRRLAGSKWARVVTVLFVISPMIAIGAAALGSHPSALMALAWLLWLTLRSRDPEAPGWTHAAVASAFGVAFFIRPLTAVGIGGPMLVAWAVPVLRRRGRERIRALASFAAPAVILAGAFLAVDWIQNGGPFTVGYARYHAYVTSLATGGAVHATGVPSLHLHLGMGSLAPTAAGLLRVSVSLFGWPCAFVFLAPAVGAKGSRLVWWSLGAFVGVSLFTINPGIDTYGPVHLAELALPILVLSGIGLARLEAWLPAAWKRLPMASVIALVVVTAVGYLPVRLRAVRAIADETARPFEAVAAKVAGPAVVFSPQPFVRYCRPDGPKGFVLYQPADAPGQGRSILWVRDLGAAADARFLAAHPGRAGWVLGWAGCRPRVTRLAAPPASPSRP